jgi:hypothetical protein
MIVALSSSAHAAKNYCRKIELTGNAGNGPNKPVEFLVRDNTGGTLLNKSCPITAGSNETDIAYITRLPYAWGTDSSNPPTTCPLPGGYDPLDPLKTQCIDYAGGSCKVKVKISPKGDGSKKKYAEVCCYAETECSGAKLGTEGTPVPITIQVQKYGTAEPCPDPNNCEDCELCVVDPDPMGMAQIPSPTAAKCRSAVAAAAATYVISAAKVSVGCHKDRLAGKIPPPVDCNDLNQADSKQIVDAAQTALADATAACAADRSPTTFGYRTCPAPCNAISLGGCTAGLIGLPVCQTDRDCDTAPGAGDGRCGDWAATSNCLSCVIENAVTTAVTDKYGNPNVSMSPEGQDCQNAIGYALANLTSARINATIACQKKRDGGKQPLAAGQSCKDLDLGGLLASIEQKAKDFITAHCNAMSVAELDAICGGASTVPGLGQCMADNVHTMNDAFSFAVIPSSALKCGDDLKTGFEECDGTDDDDCPSACTAQCKCGQLSPVTSNLTPCQPPVIDRYTFDVIAGDTISVHADTVNAASASNLCFTPGSQCSSGEAIVGDNEAPCQFPPPGGAQCPHANLVATADGTCMVGVTECAPISCQNPGVADYSLAVTRNGNPAIVDQISDNSP